tara:strand:+ start:7105 stop:8916 length:1812 start_codon:yes stop_codon:yes gene_type:complete
MATNKLTEFTLPKNAYATFDATSLKELIRQRLNENSSFTGQNFEGSNLSSLIDIISYSYHVLLFYLNQTSTESMFSEAELYENMNRIVKSLGYNPTGIQSSIASYEAHSTQLLVKGTYTIPRYTFIEAGGVFYSFTEDISFSKTTTDREYLKDFSETHLLYQGKYEEYPLVSALGDDFEVITLMPGDDLLIDHFSVDVYVKDGISGLWDKWERSSSLFLETSTSKSYEVRFNENRRYEVKFGDNRAGKKLNSGDQVAIYYLRSDGAAGTIGAGALNAGIPVIYNTIQFREIFDQVKDLNISYTSQSDLTQVSFANSNPSSEYHTGESVEDIRENAPKSFSSQYRLVTSNDYETHLKQTFSNFVKDISVVNNIEYVNGHLKYLIDTLKMSTSTKKESRTVFNTVNFADSCSFNNIYIYGVPRIEKTASTIIRTNYLTVAQKNAIIDEIRKKKMLTAETVIMDPVYVAADLGLYTATQEDLTSDVKDNTIFEVVRRPDSTVSLVGMQNSIFNVINNYFNKTLIGDLIQLSQVITDILNIEGVHSVSTVRTDTGLRAEGLHLMLFNPIYPEHDIKVISADHKLPFFKYAYLNDPTTFFEKIKILKD